MELNYLFLLPVTILVSWMVIFMETGRYHQLHDKILLALLGCCSVTCYIVLRAIVDGADDHVFIALDNVETLSGLSICPLFFLYMRTVARDAQWHAWYWWLFVPGVVLTLLGTVLSFILGWNHILESRTGYYLSSALVSSSTLEQTYVFINIRMFNITLEVMAVVLIGFSIYYLARYYRRVGDYYANLEESSALRMNYFLFSTMVLIISMFLITFFIQDIVAHGSITILCISTFLSVFVWILCHNAYKIVLTEQLLDMVSMGKEQETDNQKESAEVPQSVQEELDNLLGEKISSWEKRVDKCYCKEGLTLAMVAKDIQVNQRVLSTYINRCKGMNFNRWINTLRIEEARRMLLASSDVKIGYVSTVCGFADQAAFCKTFRLMEGCSPGEYISKNKK